jgi:flotillin
MNLLLIGGVAIATVACIIIAFIIAALYRTVVPTNMVHIVNTSKGRRVYGKDSEYGNTYYAFPSWIPKIGVSVTEFPISNFGVALQRYAAYDDKRLPFLADIQAFFVMEDADIVSQRVSDFTELKHHLTQIVSGAVRKVCAGLPIEDILKSRSLLSKDFETEVIDQLKAWGVKPVNSIEFMNIQDAENSKVIQDIQKKEESRIDRESRVVQAENAKQAQTKEIETQRQLELQRQEAAQHIGTRTAEKDQAIGIAKEQSNQAVAEQSKITAERNMEVRQVEETRRAEIDKSVAITLANQTKETQVINAEADKQKQVLDSEAKLKQDQLQAEGALAIQRANAEGIKAVGEANAESERLSQMALVDPQIILAKEIGSSEGYQNYLISVKQIEVNGEVGKAQAEALKNADIQIITGPGADLGKSLGGVLSGIASTPVGKAVIDKAINVQS